MRINPTAQSKLSESERDMQTYVDDKNKLKSSASFLPLGMMFTEEMYKANFILDKWLKRGNSNQEQQAQGKNGDSQHTAATKNEDNKNEKGEDNDSKKNGKDDENDEDDDDHNDYDDHNDDFYNDDDNDGGVMMAIPEVSF